MFEHFDHTADLGLRVRARTLEELFAEAGRGLFQMIVLNLQDVEPRQEHRVELQSDSLEYLLFDWLDELLYAFESKRLLLSQFQVEIDAEASPLKLKALCRGEVADPSRHRLDHEVKAITYHGLRVEQTREGYLAEVIVDI